MSKKYIIAMVFNVAAAYLVFLANIYAADYLAVAQWVYLASAIGLIVAIVIDRMRQYKPANKLKPNGLLRIEEPGKYQLITPYLSLACEPEVLFGAGYEFTVTEVSLDDSVIFAHELGGYVYCELPAKQVSALLSPQ